MPVDLTSVYRGVFSIFTNPYILWGAIIGIPLTITIIIVIVKIRNKYIFIYPVRIFRIRENGKVLEKNAIGGYIGRKGSSPFFRIKLGRWWWQKVDLITTPEPKYMDEQNRVYYRQNDVSDYTQLRRDFAANDVKYSAVESDAKYGAILSIQRIRQLLSVEPTWKKVLAYAGLVLVFTLGVVGWALLMNAKCPVCGGA